jgi:hypothetical protein
MRRSARAAAMARPWFKSCAGAPIYLWPLRAAAPGRAAAID